MAEQLLMTGVIDKEVYMSLSQNREDIGITLPTNSSLYNH